MNQRNSDLKARLPKLNLEKSPLLNRQIFIFFLTILALNPVVTSNPEKRSRRVNTAPETKIANQMKNTISMDFVAKLDEENIESFENYTDTKESTRLVKINSSTLENTNITLEDLYIQPIARIRRTQGAMLRSATLRNLRRIAQEQSNRKDSTKEQFTVFLGQSDRRITMAKVGKEVIPQIVKQLNDQNNFKIAILDKSPSDDPKIWYLFSMPSSVEFSKLPDWQVNYLRSIFGNLLYTQQEDGTIHFFLPKQQPQTPEKKQYLDPTPQNLPRIDRTV